MQNLSWLFLGSFFLGNVLLSAKEEIRPVQESENQEIAFEEISNQPEEKPAFATPINASRKKLFQKDEMRLTPARLEEDGTPKKTLEQRVDLAEEWLASREKIKVSDNPQNGFLSLEFLYWKAKTDDDSFGLVAKPSPILFLGLPVPTSNGKYARMDFEWRPGVRIGLGQMIHSTWSASCYWTYTRNHSSTIIPSNRLVVPFFFGSVSDGAKAKWRLNYNTMDLEFTSALHLIKNFTFKPYVGLRGSWLHQNLHTLFAYRTQVKNAAGAPEWAFGPATELYKEQYWGVGPRGGAFVNFEFGRSGFNLYGNFSGALLAGRVHVYENKELHIPNPGLYPGLPINISFKFRDGFGDVKATLQALVGAEYKYFFDNGKKAVSLYSGWEANYWWDMNDYYHPSDTFQFANVSEAIALYGITAGVTFEY